MADAPPRGGGGAGGGGGDGEGEKKRAAKGGSEEPDPKKAGDDGKTGSPAPDGAVAEAIGEDGFEAEIEVSDDARLRFTMHNGPVHCIALDKDGGRALSGDQEDTAILWDTKSGKVIKKLGGHTDTVVATGWNSDFSAFATASMDGTVRIHKESGKVRTLKGPETEIYWFQWHHKGPVVLAGCGDGTVWMWHAMNGKCMQVFAGHADVVSCGGFSHDGKLVVSGSYDEKVIVWSPKTGEPLHRIQAKNMRGFHNAPLTCLAVHHSKPIMVTGAEDGTVWLCSLSKDSSKPLKQLAEHKQSVEAASFSKVLDLVLTASADGSIIVTDVSNKSVRARIETEGAITSALWHPKAPAFFSCGTDTLVQLWDARNGKMVRQYSGHSDTVLCLAVSQDGSSVFSAGDDGTCAVFEVKKKNNSDSVDRKNPETENEGASEEKRKAIDTTAKDANT